MTRRLLLVEDNELNRDMLTRRLKRAGFDIAHAVDGEAAVRRAVSLVPDLILMDISIPKMDGHEATRRIKAQHATAHVPVIALTAHALPEDELAARRAGADDFATKPVDFNELVAKIHRLIGTMPGNDSVLP
jgi:two-component system, cell cycle response regulator DivK